MIRGYHYFRKHPYSCKNTFLPQFLRKWYMDLAVFFCMTSGRGLIHPLEWNTLCPFIARRNGHRLRQMRCKGKLISWSCLSCPYFLFLPLDLTWSRCCAALLAKFSEDSFFHVVTASEKACSMPSGCRCFGKGCDWHRSSFFRNMILSYFRTK